MGFPDGGADDLEVMLCRGQYIYDLYDCGKLVGRYSGIELQKEIRLEVQASGR